MTSVQLEAKPASFLEELEERQRGETVAEMMYYLRRETCVVHLFFEGDEDKIFYLFHLKKMHPALDDYEIYECGGRDAVISLSGRLAMEEKRKLLFFIDRDLCPIEDRRIFQTRDYSFENYYIDQTVMNRFAENYLGATTAVKRRKIADKYKRFEASAMEIATMYSNVVDQARKVGKEIIFDRYPPTKMVEVDDSGEVTLSEYGKKVIGDIRNSIERNVENKKRDYCIGRGKTILSWLGIFIKKTVHYIRENIKEWGCKPTVMPDFGNRTIISILSPFTDTPDELVKYLKGSLAL